eukprot:jgi/Tetstr1/458941/TSEL_004412.t1
MGPAPATPATEIQSTIHLGGFSPESGAGGSGPIFGQAQADALLAAIADAAGVSPEGVVGLQWGFEGLVVRRVNEADTPDGAAGGASNTLVVRFTIEVPLTPAARSLDVSDSGGILNRLRDATALAAHLAAHGLPATGVAVVSVSLADVDVEYSTPEATRPRYGAPIGDSVAGSGNAAARNHGRTRITAGPPLESNNAPSTPEPTIAPPTPEPTIAPPTPEPTIAPPTPEPTTPPPTPEPTTAPPTPEPTAAPSTPEPAIAPPTPEPTAAPRTPEPTAAPPTPEPTTAPPTPDAVEVPLTTEPSTTVPTTTEPGKSEFATLDISVVFTRP